MFHIIFILYSVCFAFLVFNIPLRSLGARANNTKTKSVGEGYVVVITNIRENIISIPKCNKGKRGGGVGVGAVWKKRRQWTYGTFFCGHVVASRVMV